MKLLVINPNSSKSMTRSLANSIKIPDISLDYYTAPITAPREINNENDALISAKAVLADLKSNKKYMNYDGYIVACYSDHPLVGTLRECVKSNQHVMGIFQASMLYTLNITGSKAAIMTSGEDWEKPLDSAIIKFLGSKDWPIHFINTQSVGLTPLQLEDPENYRILHQKITFLQAAGVKFLLLGCAGLSSLNDKFKRDFPNITFVDGVHVAVHLLKAYISIGNI